MSTVFAISYHFVVKDGEWSGSCRMFCAYLNYAI